MNARHSILILAAALGAAWTGIAPAQTNTFAEDFTRAATANNWFAFNGACLTAGSGAGSASTTTAGLIPSCASIFSSYYNAAATGKSQDAALVGGQNGVVGNASTLPDPVGKGALRFTNGACTPSNCGFGEHGAIVSSTPFNAGNGVQITFKTVTYRGNSGGAAADGADGMSFYLIDGSLTPASPVWNGIGSWGGSLGYTCSNANPPYDGLVGAYLGLGIDEYGNFLNGSKLMAGAVTGVNGVGAPTGDNSALGYGYVPGRIGLRGAGTVSWVYLNATYPADYPLALTAAQRQSAVQATCKSGTVWNYSNPGSPKNTGTAIADYNPIPNAYSVLAGVQIANEAAMARPDGAVTGNVILYDLRITQSGLLSFAYSVNGGAFNQVISSQDITASNAPLPGTLLFGFAGSTGGSTNIHEVLCFKAAPTSVSATSASVNQKQTSQIQTTSQAHFAFYNPNDWTGRVTAYGLVDTAGVVTLQNTATWDSQCALTGTGAAGTCLYTGQTGISALPPASRAMWAWNGLDTAANPGTGGIGFEWASLTAAEQAALAAQTRLNYLRGDRSQEITSSGTGLYRRRIGVLGDIVDASPTWVGPPSAPYPQTWADTFVPTDTMLENSGQSYPSFVAAQQSRLNVIYAGANDGFLHGFRTGSEDASGNVINNATTPNDGLEVMAYMPGAVMNAVHSATTNLDYSNPQYAHAFFVDATPGAGDLFYGGAWHTWLVGGLGIGGKSVYALDITNPSATNFTEANAGALVKGEWSSATITCANVAGCGNSLGNTFGTPQIRRFHNGTWGAVFGNGYGSTNGDAGIYVMTVSQSTGAVTFYYYSAGAAGGNGIAFVAPVDLDGDHVSDYVYAGDLKGNVWRFDLTSSNPAAWGVTSPGPLFKTATGQPITTPIVASSIVLAGSAPQVMLSFGTGQRSQFTTTSATQYTTGTQSLYGVWDWNLSTWNTKSSHQYASLTAVQFNSATGLAAPYTMSQTNLQQQTFTLNTGTTPATVTASDIPITWEQCGATCNAGKFGWFVNLSGSNGLTLGGKPVQEQIVSNPSLFGGALLVNSTIPANNHPLDCNSPETDTGVTYALSAATGGAFGAGGTTPTSSTTVFNSAFVNYRDTATVGLMTNETGSLSVVNTREATTYIIGQDTAIPAAGTAPGQAQQVSLSNASVNRLTWVELR
jgi:type IV pilus assembly protein PilY1